LGGRLSSRALAGLFVLSVLAARPALAIDPAKELSQCSIDVWQVRDGLPGAWLRGLTQTPDGYLWINALGGVVRYDGARLVRLSGGEGIAPGPEGDINTALFDVADMLPLRDGRLWIAPIHSPPLCLTDGELEPCLRQDFHVLPSDRMVQLADDGDDGVWMATRMRLYHVRDRQVVLDRGASDLGLPRISHLHRDAGGRLWAGTAAGLYVAAPGAVEPQFRRYDGPGGPIDGLVTSLIESARGGLWVSTADSVVRIAPAGARLYTRDQGLPPARLGPLLEDRDGSLWVASEAGLARLRGEHFEVYRAADGLPDEQITTLFEDREGSLWVGTRAGGLVQFTDRTLDTSTGPPSLRGQSVETLSEDDQGNLWFGTVRNGLVRWRAGETTTFTTADGLPSNRLTAVLPGGPGEMWIGTGSGLARFHGGRIEVVPGFTGSVSALYRDAAGTLHVGGDDGRVLRLRDGRFEPLALPFDRAMGQIRSLAHDSEGHLWISGAAAMTHETAAGFLPVVPTAEVPMRQARSIHRDAEGTLWFGTHGAGVVRLRGGHLRAFGPEVGMPGQIYQLITDDLGHLWMGTGHGIQRVSLRVLDDVAEGRRRSVDLVSFERSDGRREVVAPHVHQPGVWKTRDGRLWFGADIGVVTIDPRRLRVNNVAPTVLVQEASVDGRALRRGRPNRLAPGPGNLELHFAAVTLLEPDKAVHRYLLEGFDEHWIEAGTRRVAYYTHVPPGQYRFRVQASNADGIWNEGGDALDFYLAPHFYRTPLFYAVVASAVLSLAFWFHRSRVRRVRAQSLAAAAERTRVARELHDNLLQSMSGVAMHLNAVRARLPLSAHGVADKLAAIEATVTASLAETRRFVWDLREPNDVDPVDLGGGLSRLARRFSADSTATCRVTVEGDPIALPSGTNDELLRIAGEALANALKHADPRTIEVVLRYQDEQVLLAVSDDGRGFDPQGAQACRPGHFGLQGLRERAARVGGTLLLDSVPGRGTRVEVTLPLPAEERAHG
jgi:signal transduction histidine kinase/ligand-binding sensor domain-containing protein